jgi:hypothetical protein
MRLQRFAPLLKNPGFYDRLAKEKLSRKINFSPSSADFEEKSSGCCHEGEASGD